MRRKIHLAVAAALVVASGLGACGKKPGPTGPTAGEFTVSFSGGFGNDGALLLLVAGRVTSIQAVGGYQIASASAGPNATRVVVTGNLVSGNILKLSVPDVAAIASYDVTVEAAADRTSFALADPNLYSTTIRD